MCRIHLPHICREPKLMMKGVELPSIGTVNMMHWSSALAIWHPCRLLTSRKIIHGDIIDNMVHIAYTWMILLIKDTACWSGFGHNLVSSCSHRVLVQDDAKWELTFFPVGMTGFSRTELWSGSKDLSDSSLTSWSS